MQCVHVWNHTGRWLSQMLWRKAFGNKVVDLYLLITALRQPEHDGHSVLV
jgi:hypothetical protein